MYNNDMFANYPDVVTVKDLYRMLPIGRNSAYSLVRNNVIESIRMGSKYLIPKTNVIKYLFDQQNKMAS